MFALRMKLSELLCNSDLTVWQALDLCILSNNPKNISSQPLLSTTESNEHCRELSQHEELHKASTEASELAFIASEASNVHFKQR